MHALRPRCVIGRRLSSRRAQTHSNGPAWTNSCRPVYPPFVGEHERLYEHIMLRRSDAAVPFAALCSLLKRLGFDERIRGDHHIFATSRVEEILNLQPKGGRAKPYQVRQVREVLLKYNLDLED